MVSNYLNTAELEAKQTPVPALFLLCVALVSLSFTAIFIKISLYDISANSTLFNRLWIATLIFGAWSGLSRMRSEHSKTAVPPQENLSRQDMLLLVIVAVIHVVGRFFWTWSITQTSVVNATLLANMPPIFTVLGGWLVLGQRFNRRFLLGMAIALMGALTLGLNDLSTPVSDLGIGGTMPAIGDAAALLSAVFYAASCLIIERLRASICSQNILFWRCFIGSVVMLPIVLTTEEVILPVSLTGWLMVLCLAAICEALGHGLVVYSLKYLSSAFVNVFLLLESVLTAIFAYFIFSESLGPVNLLTFALILGGVFIARTSDGSVKATTEEG
ncbi:DMT family transporter [Oscillatoria sp. CS-180]|uniref:DMT family transporter n=1 Tax=Oscillatoria sp. CS-180 TaxID=3021720 RepID=UPI00232C57F0|nr:DMT family transporter [Oscillatoria sp. CS-180]MDB9528353.1 DMT family transporter [Oscillatoria sp. CS-180]